ncbi:MAG: hypothetical protein ACEQSB_03870 [Undibacterium sp.]
MGVGLKNRKINGFFGTKKTLRYLKLSDRITDIFSLLAISGVGWFLVGWYTPFEYLNVGYPDWLYHAFRIRDISQFGIASWDHIWANGLNHWRAFQYVEHVFTNLISQLTGLSITRSMIWITVILFIALRLTLYIALRLIGVRPLFSFFAVIVSYTFSQEWASIKDYSTFLAFSFVPFYIVLWIDALRYREYIYFLAAVSGALWSVHPVVGYSATGLLGLLIFANNIKSNFKELSLIVVTFLISSAPFSVPYLFETGYSFSNPLFSTQQFLQSLILPDYFGLSLIYFILIIFCWIVFIWKSNVIARWAKVLLFYCSAYLIFIYFGQLGYYPEFINKFQFSRAIPFIAITLVFCFAAFLEAAFQRVRSRMVMLVIGALISVVITISVEKGSMYTPMPINEIQDPVVDFFADREIPKGSIYFKDGVESSYLAKSGLRFITSYNQHLLPNPYPIRFDSLMKSDISFTGVTAQQIQLINDYSLVLGIEYLFVPKLSPLVTGLTLPKDGSLPQFEKVGEADTDKDVYVVLKSTAPISLTYIVDDENVLRFSEIPKPTLKATSYRPWDEEISRTAELIRNKKITPIDIDFIWPNALRVKNSESLEGKRLLVMQSYDRYWGIKNQDNASIQPTNLRFMYVTNLQNPGNEIVLVNNWPKWHWPVQGLGLAMVAITGAFLVIGKLSYRRRNLMAQNDV